MSRRPEVEERVRALARQHPGWSPSQVAIYLQGEGVKITSEDVRRTLARPATDPGTGEVVRPSRYVAPPRAEPRRNPLPVGLLFGVLAFLSSLAFLALGSAIEAGVGVIASLVAAAVVLLVSGAMGSRRYANGALSGLIAALVYGVVLFSLLAVGVAGTLGITQATLAQTGLDVTPGEIGAALATTALVALLVLALVGLLLGWLGARFFGRKKRRGTLG